MEDKYMEVNVSEHEKRMFQEAGQRHAIFLHMTKQKYQNVDMRVVEEHVRTAENLYLQLLNSHPEWDQLVYQLATLYLQTNRNGLTIRLIKPLADREDATMEWLNNLGAAYRNEHFNEEAMKYFTECLTKYGRNPDVLANMCALYVNEGYPEKGIPYGRECIALDRNHCQGTWNMGLLLLENGEWAEGFSLYARGFDTGERIIRSYVNKEGGEAPFWKGQDLDGKTIVLHGEQGIGDELLFLQFLPSFQKKYPNTELILDCHPRLLTALQRSLPEVAAIFPTRKAVPEWNTITGIRVDYKDGIGSLPAYFWKDMSTHAGWLKPKEELVEHYKNIIRRLQEERGQEGYPVIGIAWEGGKKKTRNDLRSIGLDEWDPIFKNQCTFISLQYTKDAAKEVSRVRKKTGVTVHHWADVTENFDYEHSIALAAATDLVIGVNTSIIHVCGSMGHPCWTLTPHGHAWRYGKKEQINPFYKSVEQFHQDPDEDWKRIIQKVAHRLRYVHGGTHD